MLSMRAVAVHQRDPAVVGGGVRPKPRDEPIHVVDFFEFRWRGTGRVHRLQLAGEIAAGLAVIGEARRGDVDRVQPRKAVVHRVEDRGPRSSRSRLRQAPESHKMRPSTKAMR